MGQQDKEEQAKTLIYKHMAYATAAGMIPIPIADIAAVSAIHLDMIKQLASLYNVDYNESSGKSLIAAVSGGLIGRLGASAIKLIPGIGTILGGVSGAVITAATTYALGQTFQWHFSTGGDLTNFNVNNAKKVFEQNLAEGEKVAKEMNVSESAASPNHKTIFETIEKLAELKNQGIISEEEFSEQKKRLLEQLHI
jgi:uncharacterized protein (DUF697 family)